ncbi:hypothetical protein KJ765_06550 [Candidatus Micrarchaeota archaeon]|nr:hypothetical protein [Candidatus Micrarchaeota archaeon]
MDPEDLKRVYAQFAEFAESKGLPALPSLIILIILVLAILAFLTTFFLPKSVISELKVTVLSESGEAVSDARVQLFDEKGNFIDEQRSDAQGRALFSNVNLPKVVVKVLKNGYELATAVVQNKPSVSVELSPEQTIPALETLSITVLVLDHDSGSAISKASIQYASDRSQKSSSAETDAQGKAVLLVSEGRTVNTRVSHPNYLEKSFSFLPKKGKVVEVTLQRRSGSATPRPSGAPADLEYGSLEVLVKDPDGNPVSQSTVTVFDASTDVQLASKDTVNGKTTFDGLLVGSRVYLAARSDLFLPYAGSQQIKIKALTKHEISLRSDGLTEDFKVRTLDEEGNLVSSTISLYTSDSRLVLQQESSGESVLTLADIELALGEDPASLTYYVSAFSDARLPAVSGFFTAPFSEDVSLFLEMATAENSAALTIQTQDASRNALSGAEVRVLSEDKTVLLESNTDSSASLTVYLPINFKYTVEEHYSGETGYGRVLLLQNEYLEIFLSGPVTFLEVSAYDAFSEAPVFADFALSVEDESFDYCSGTLCYLRLPHLSSGIVDVFASEYFDYSSEVFSGGEDEKSVPLFLLPIDELEGSYVQWLGVFDAFDNQVSELQAGLQYTAKLLVGSSDAEETGVYFRLGTGSDLEQGEGQLLSYDALTPADSVVRSPSYVPGPVCPVDTASDDGFKWMELVFNGPMVQDVSFRFQVKNNVQGKTSIPFFYRAYALQDDGYFRVPPDEQLGFLESTPDKGGCYASTFEESLPLVQVQEFRCQAAGCLSIALEQDGFLAGDGFQARALEGPSGLECDDSCDGCEDSCVLSALFVHLDFDPSPSFSNRPFNFRVSQRGGLLAFKKYSVNHAASMDSQASSVLASVSDSSYYDVKVTSWPLREGEETVTVEVWPENLENQKIRETIDFSILTSCGRGKRICEDGSCQYLCITLPDPSEEPELEVCPSGKMLCLDGICRVDCGFIGTPTPEPTLQPCSENWECYPQQCDVATGYCESPDAAPEPCEEDSECDSGSCNENTRLCDETPSADALCSEAGGSCVGGCGDYEECSPIEGACTAGVCCTGSCSTPLECTYNYECASGECDQSTGTCIPSIPTENGRCTVNVQKSELNSGQSTMAQVNYFDLSSAPQIININCGNDRATVATNCADRTGLCSAMCYYPNSGSFSVSASIGSKACTDTFVDVISEPDPTIDCHYDGDCGLDGYSGEPFCQNGDVYSNYGTRSCDFGTCSNVLQAERVQNCLRGCQNGVCVGDSGGPTPTPRPGIGIDIVNGQLVTNIASIQMQADPIFPGDVVKFDITDKCTHPLTAIRSPNADCFSVQDGYIIFRGGPYRPSCPIDLSGGQLTQAGESVLELTCPGDASNVLSLPIDLRIDNSFPTTYLEPASLEGSSSKLFHIISEAQGQRRLSINNQQFTEFDRAGAKSYAWSGDGLLELFENDGKAASLVYAPTSTYYQDISDQGPRKESCSDAFCCADGWCTTQAAAGSFSAFKQLAQNMADQTAFRTDKRAKLPISKITDQPFIFSTVIRLLQGAKLPSQVSVQDSPSQYGCESDAPAVYEVYASTYDGFAWTYRARISRLYRYQYVSPNQPPSCPGSSRTPASEGTESFSRQSSGGYLALCDFLTGKPDCVDSDPNANLAAAEQVKDKENLTPIPIPSSFWQIPVRKLMCDHVASSQTTSYTSAVRTCDAAYLAEMNICGDVYAACSAATCAVLICPCCAQPACAAELTACEAAAYSTKIACKEAAYTATQAATKAGAVTASGIDIDFPGFFPLTRTTQLLCSCLVGLPEPLYGPPPEGVVICIEKCNPKRSYVVSSVCDNQMYAVVHAGVTETCHLDYVGIAIAGAQVYTQYKYPEYSVYANWLGTLLQARWGVTDAQTPAILKALEKTLNIPLSGTSVFHYQLQNGLESVFYSVLCKKLAG